MGAGKDVGGGVGGWGGGKYKPNRFVRGGRYKPNRVAG